MKILIDADHCPARIRQILIKTAEKRQIRLVFVSARPLPVKEGPNIVCLLVTPGVNAADDKIVESASGEDFAVTADIPLATRLVKSGLTVIHPKGDIFTQKTMGERLAGYNLAKQLRDQGIDVSGYKTPSRYQNQDSVKLFADALDRELTKRKKNIESKS